jgi:hypothetical protein
VALLELTDEALPRSAVRLTKERHKFRRPCPGQRADSPANVSMRRVSAPEWGESALLWCSSSGDVSAHVRMMAA